MPVYPGAPQSGPEPLTATNEGLADLPLFNAQIGQREMYANVWGTVTEDFGEYRYVLDELLSARVSV
jgi:hypothetical protein